MTECSDSRLVPFEIGPPERRRGADRRSGHDRRIVDLLRETGRPEHEHRCAVNRRSGRDRRQDERPADAATEVILPSEIVTPWQIA
jgi:hypothetical protein